MREYTIWSIAAVAAVLAADDVMDLGGCRAELGEFGLQPSSLGASRRK